MSVEFDAFSLQNLG